MSRLNSRHSARDEKVDTTDIVDLYENEQNHVFEAIDPAEEKAVVRRLDSVIMPLMAVVYFFQCEYRPGNIQPNLHFS